MVTARDQVENLANRKQQKPKQRDTARVQSSELVRKGSVRKRATAACEQCRARKRKCDGNAPACGACNKRRSECVYASRVEAWEWNEKMLRTLKARLDELQNLDRSTSPKQIISPVANDCTGEDTPLNRQNTASRATDADSTCWDGLSCSYTEKEDNNVENIEDSDGPAMDTLIAATASQPAFTAFSHPTGGSRSSKKTMEHSGAEPVLNELFRPLEVASREHESGNSMKEDFPSMIVDTATSTKFNCTCDQSLDLLHCALPLRRQADHLVENFFHRHNRMFPVLHQDSFMQRYQCLWQPQSSTDVGLGYMCLGLCKQWGNLPLFLALINVMFAISTLTSPGEPEQNTQKADIYFAKAWHNGVHELFDYDDGFEPIQVGLLMSLYLQSTEKFSKCWTMLGLTISMARNKGLSQENDADDARCIDKQYSTALTSEMRVRLWSMCIVLDTELSLSFGRSYTIDVSVTHAKVLLLNDVTDPKPLLGEEAQLEVHAATTEYFDQNSKLYKLLRQVMLVNTVDFRAHQERVGRVSSVKIVAELHDQVLDWFEQLPKWLRYAPRADAKPSQPHLANGVNTNQLRPPLTPNDLSIRLFCRYLHTVQLALRPALVTRYEMLLRPQPTMATHSLRNKFYTSMLNEMAVQCVISGIQLIDVISEQIESQDFICWWYNICYLYTCGSTFLLAFGCGLHNLAVPVDLLTSSWSKCLRHLSLYVKVSNVAKNCYDILQEKFKQISPKMLQQTVVPFANAPKRMESQAQDLSSQSDDMSRPPPSTWTTTKPSLAFGNQNTATQGLADNQGLFAFANLYPNTDTGLEAEVFDMLGENTDSVDFNDTLSWPAMPYLAQLEMRSF